MMTSRNTRTIIICLVLMKSASLIVSGNCDLDEHYCLYTDKCIDSDYLCDGDNDCGDFSDEAEDLCSAHIFATAAITVVPGECEENHIACSEEVGSKCILRTWVCDGEWDCYNGTDESHCPQTESPTTTTLSLHHKYTRIEEPEQKCSHDQFRCPFTCINKNWVCDDEDDCHDGSDENPLICERKSASATQSTSTIQSYSTPGVASATQSTLTIQSYSKPGVASATQSTSTIQSYSTRGVASATVVESPTKKDFHSNNSTEDCDVQTSASFTSSLWNWIPCALLVVGITCITAIVVFVCKKRKRRSAGLNSSRDVEGRRQAVSFLNSNIVPECQLVLVGTPVQVQPTIVQAAQAIDQPPPYDAQSSPNLTRTQHPTKTEIYLS